MKISTARTMIILACFFVTQLLLRHLGTTSRIPIIQPLARFPVQLGTWHKASTNTASPAIIAMLGVDDYIDYSYRDDAGRVINLYVAFYESLGTTGTYHSPKNCLPGSGWGIEEVNSLRLAPPGPQQHAAEVAEMILRNHSDYQVIIYWYQNRGRIISSEYWEKIYLVLDALFKHRRDGAFVRISITPAPEELTTSRKTLQEFARLALGELDQFLPGS